MILGQLTLPSLPPKAGGIWLTLVAVIAIAGIVSPTNVNAADDEDTIEAHFRKIVPWLPKGLPTVGEVAAFEENSHFVYLAGQSSALGKSTTGDNRSGTRIRLAFLRPATLVVDLWPFEAGQWNIGRPTAMYVGTLPSSFGSESQRAVCVYRSTAEETAPRLESNHLDDETIKMAIMTKNRSFHLAFPLELGGPARIAVDSADGTAILADRLLPNGLLPHGKEGMQLIERWDSRYRQDSRPPWDKGFASSHLRAAVESGAVQPGRAVVLGCGTGTNAIYLATKGFDVTAIDIAPTALGTARQKARESEVNVRWMLADVLAPPVNLEPFDLIFDRGCYHGVRRDNALGYVDALKRLSRAGTQVLILAGNANEERHYGPPRVKEDELRGDFSSSFEFVSLKTVRFDSVDPDTPGALAWSALLRRKVAASR